MRWGRVAVCVGVAWSVVGCGPASTGGSTYTPARFAQEMQALSSVGACRYVFECPQLAYDAFLSAGRYATFEACEEGHRTQASEFVALLGGGDEDVMGFDRRAARDCVREYEALLDERVCSVSSDTFYLATPLPSVCGDVFTGTVAPNAACANTFECEGDNVCAVPEGTCGGACVEPGRVACGDRLCAAEQRCDEGTCVDYDPFACGSSSECGPGEVCNRSVCIPRRSLEVGSACSSGSACGPDLSCNRDGGEGVCAVVPEYAVVGEGEACRYDYEAGSFDQHCAPGLVCATLVDGFPAERVGECAAPRGAGEPCLLGLECGPGLYCSGFLAEEGVCVAVKPAGEACDFGSECVSGACVDGRCGGEGACP